MDLPTEPTRCAWARTPLSILYHDTEWGSPVHDDLILFEFLTLEGAQAGLNWETILQKREDYRNRLKINSAVTNAKNFLAVQRERGSFDAYVWAFVGGRPRVNEWRSLREIPSRTAESDALSRDLKKRGFTDLLSSTHKTQDAAAHPSRSRAALLKCLSRPHTVSGVPMAGSKRSTIPSQRKATGKLAALNVQLQREIAARERAEKRRRAVELGLKEVRERFEAAFGTAPIGMALVDMNGRWLQVNEALCRITGYAHDELKATTLDAITHPDDVDLGADDLQRLLTNQIPSYQVEKRYRHAWGHYVWVLLTCSVVRDADGRALHVITQVQDISERKELARHLEYLVDHDFLTGLYNRRYFERELAREVERAKRYGSTAAVLVMDLDHFKDINDSLGHKAGDDLLKGVAGVLKHRARQADVLARLGGDEFALLLPQTSADHAEIVADEIVKTLNRRMVASASQSIVVTASVGVAISDGLTDTELLAYADLAMYEAKEAGRNRCALYRPLAGGRERVSARLAEAERIRHTLEEDRLLLYGQPVIDLQTNAVHHYELLVRLPGDEGGDPFPPSAFLYVAERFGLIQALDGWVVRSAIRLIAEQAQTGRELVLSVNLSGKSIGDPKLVLRIEQALDEAGIDPARLIFELTETAAIANIEQAKNFATRLHSCGCRLALDDFGAGFGSFYYLKNFPFDSIKIDGGFIRGITSNPMDQLVVQAIVTIARGLGKKTVAEFVAEQETVSLLRNIGVDCAQGYFIGEPRPITEILSTGAFGA